MNWKRAHYWLEHDGGDLNTLAAAVYRRVMRQAFDQPGFAIAEMPEAMTSGELRGVMVQLKRRLSELFYDEWDETLLYRSLGRFDQQTTTKLHLDGAPERSFLMLGYEPTEVASEFLIADYTACACGMGLTPGDFLAQYNPMFATGHRLLEPWMTVVRDWMETMPRIVVINNSSTAPNHPAHVPGVLHGARIPSPDAAMTRIINSTMMIVGDGSFAEDAASVETFLTSDAVSGAIAGRS